MKQTISKNRFKMDNKGSISIITAMITAVFVGALIVPLTVYHQNAQRSQVITKQKYEALEYLEQSAKMLQQKYAAKELEDFGHGNSSNKKICVVNGAGKELCTRKIDLMGGDNKITNAEYTVAKDMRGITIVANYNGGAYLGESHESPGDSNPGSSDYPTTRDQVYTQPQTPPQITDPVRIPSTQPTQPTKPTQPAQPGKPQPTPQNLNSPVQDYPGKSRKPRQGYSSEVNLLPVLNKEATVELILPTEMFNLSLEEKVFFAIEKVLPDFLKSEEPEFDGNLIHLANAVTGSQEPGGSPASVASGETGMARISNNSNQVSFSYAWNANNLDVQINCKNSAYSCVEVKICPPQYAKNNGCVENKYYTQQVVFYGEAP